MSREKEGYRDILADILEFTGGKRELSMADVEKYLGTERRHIKKRYGITAGGIVAPLLARKLCDCD